MRWKVASDLRFRVAISEAETPSFRGISGDLAPSTRRNRQRSQRAQRSISILKLFNLDRKAFNLARKFQSRRLDLTTKIGAAVGGSLEISFPLEIFNLARNLDFFLIFALTLQPLLFWKKQGFSLKKARVFLFAEPLKSLEKKGKMPPKSKENRKQKKQGNRKKQGLEGQGGRSGIAIVRFWCAKLWLTNSQLRWPDSRESIRRFARIP